MKVFDKGKEGTCFRSTGKVLESCDDHLEMVGKEINWVTPILVFYVVELF
jgi:hypothetical protein